MKGTVNQSGNSDTNNNSKLFLSRALVTTGSAIAQDVIINGNILLNSVNDPTDLFMKSITETSVFAFLFGNILPIFTERFKSTPVDMACAVALPFAAEMISHAGNNGSGSKNIYILKD